MSEPRTALNPPFFPLLCSQCPNAVGAVNRDVVRWARTDDPKPDKDFRASKNEHRFVMRVNRLVAPRRYGRRSVGRVKFDRAFYASCREFANGCAHTSPPALSRLRRATSRIA